MVAIAGLRHPSRRPILKVPPRPWRRCYPRRTRRRPPRRGPSRGDGDARVRMGPQRQPKAPRPYPTASPGRAQGDVLCGILGPARARPPLGFPTQDELVLRRSIRSRDGAGDDLARGVVSAEGVYRDTHWRAPAGTRLDVFDRPPRYGLCSSHIRGIPCVARAARHSWGRPRRPGPVRAWCALRWFLRARDVFFFGTAIRVPPSVTCLLSRTPRR